MENYLYYKVDSKFNFKTVTNDEVLTIIGSLEPKTSSGIDNISSKELMQLAPTLHPVITPMINQSMVMGIFYDQLKIAIVTPIYKGK